MSATRLARTTPAAASRLHLAAWKAEVLWVIGFGVLGGRFLEGAARQPELMPVLRVQMFVVAALVDAVAFIGIGFALFFTFANPFVAAAQSAAQAAGAQ